MIALVLALTIASPQEAPAEAAARIVERHERAVRDLEESLVALGEAGIPEVRKLLEHPKAEVREAGGRALARIQKLAPEIQTLIEKLASDSPEERERATEELMKLGSPARGSLETAARGTDREKALRAKGILLTLDPTGSRRASWAARADLEERSLADVRAQVDHGLAPRTALDEAELRRLKAQWKADRIDSREYFTSKKEVLTRSLTHLEKLHQQGVTSKADLLRARLALATVNRHLGTGKEEEVRRIQRLLWDALRMLVERGVIPEREALSQYAESILDEDL